MAFPEDHAGGSAGVQAIETGLSILEALAAHPQPMMLKDIALATGMHAAKIHRYLASFARGGYVEQEADGRYGLGEASLLLGLACLARLDAVRLATPIIDALVARTSHTVLAAVWGNMGPTVVQWRDAPHPAIVNVKLGSVMPLLSSATGRVFSAFLDRKHLGTMISRELRLHARSRPMRYPNDEKTLAEMIDAVRTSGLGVVNGDLLAGISSVSAPVFDHNGRLALALTVLGHEGLFDTHLDAEPALALRHAAGQLSGRLGYRVKNSLA